MIVLDVQEYCHNCRDFEADVEKPEKLMSDDGKTVAQTDTVIRCEKRNRCASIKRYLEREQGGFFSNRCHDI